MARPLNRALYPPAAARQTAGRGPKCPAAKSTDSVMSRPDDRMADELTVAPGPARASTTTRSSGAIPDGSRWASKPAFGVRRQDLIVKDVRRDVVDEGRAPTRRGDPRASRRGGAAVFRRWRSKRSATGPRRDHRIRRCRSRRPTSTIVTFRPRRPRRRRRDRGGVMFGVLVHAVLAQVAARCAFVVHWPRARRRRRAGAGGDGETTSRRPRGRWRVCWATIFWCAPVARRPRLMPARDAGNDVAARRNSRRRNRRPRIRGKRRVDRRRLQDRSRACGRPAKNVIAGRWRSTHLPSHSDGKSGDGILVRV